MGINSQYQMVNQENTENVGSVAKIKKQVFLAVLNHGLTPFFEATFRQKIIFATEPFILSKLEYPHRFISDKPKICKASQRGPKEIF